MRNRGFSLFVPQATDPRQANAGQNKKKVIGSIALGQGTLFVVQLFSLVIVEDYFALHIQALRILFVILSHQIIL